MGVFSGITSCEDYWKIHILTMADEILNTKRPHVVILEQPVSDTRFRYPIEGRGAGVLKGEHSSAEKTTFPKIKIVGYKGPAVVVVSCVTHDTKLPRCHPHNLVSPATVNNKDSCRKGVFHTSVNTESMTVEFSHLGVQCVRKKDIEESLERRQKIRVDPYKQGFDHKNNPKAIDLNAIKLCFQVFLESPSCRGRFTEQLAPVCSRTVYSARVMSQLQIIEMSDTTSPASGGKKIILVCDEVRKQCAIVLRSPQYSRPDITQAVRVSLQLVRP